MATNYEVIRSTLYSMANGYGQDKYVVIDKETGALLDDAGGYGYGAEDSASRAASYKLSGKKTKNGDVMKLMTSTGIMFDRLDENHPGFSEKIKANTNVDGDWNIVEYYGEKLKSEFVNQSLFGDDIP